MTGPLPGTVLKICPEAECTLIPLLSGLCQQLHDDLRERLGDRGSGRAGGRGQLRDVAVDQFEGGLPVSSS